MTKPRIHSRAPTLRHLFLAVCFLLAGLPAQAAQILVYSIDGSFIDGVSNSTGGCNLREAIITLAQSRATEPERQRRADRLLQLIQSEEFGEQICAHIEPLAGSAIDAIAVRSYLGQHLARYKVPKVVELSAALPREDSGKIFKRKLRAPYWEKAGRSI